jgi:hypothetical protein
MEKSLRLMTGRARQPLIHQETRHIPEGVLIFKKTLRGKIVLLMP